MIVSEIGMQIGEVLALQRVDVCLEPGREAGRRRERPAERAAEPQGGRERASRRRSSLAILPHPSALVFTLRSRVTRRSWRVSANTTPVRRLTSTGQ